MLNDVEPWRKANDRLLPTNAVEASMIEVAKVEAFWHGNVPTVCPLGGRYADFLLRNGPVCPNGHQLTEKEYRYMHLFIVGPKDKDDLEQALSDGDPRVRWAAVGRTMSSPLLHAPEKNLVLLRAIRDQDASVRSAVLEKVAFLRQVTPELAAAVSNATRDADSGVSAFAIRVFSNIQVRASTSSQSANHLGSEGVRAP